MADDTHRRITRETPFYVRLEDEERIAQLEASFADIGDLLSEPQNIDLATALADLEQAADHFVSQTLMAKAAALVATAIAFSCDQDFCVRTRLSEIPEERYVALKKVLSSRRVWTDRDPEYRAVNDCEVIYSVIPLYNGDGTLRRVLVRAAEGLGVDDWWLLAPVHGPDDRAMLDERTFTSPADDNFEFHMPPLEVLLAFAREARSLVAELAHEMRLIAEDTGKRATQLEQLAAVSSG